MINYIHVLCMRFMYKIDIRGGGPKIVLLEIIETLTDFLTSTMTDTLNDLMIETSIYKLCLSVCLYAINVKIIN